MTPFWLVINMGEFGKVPTKRHETEESAREEAARIAAKYPSVSVFVVAAVSCYKATATVEHDDVMVVPYPAPNSPDMDYLGLPYATDCDNKRIYKNDTLQTVSAVVVSGDGLEGILQSGTFLRVVDSDSPGPGNTVLVANDRGQSFRIASGGARIIQAGG